MNRPKAASTGLVPHVAQEANNERRHLLIEVGRLPNDPDLSELRCGLASEKPADPCLQLGRRKFAFQDLQHGNSGSGKDGMPATVRFHLIHRQPGFFLEFTADTRVKVNAISEDIAGIWCATKKVDL